MCKYDMIHKTRSTEYIASSSEQHQAMTLGNKYKQEGLAKASIARDDPSTLPGDDPFPRARMHRDRNARGKLGSEFET